MNAIFDSVDEKPETDLDAEKREYIRTFKLLEREPKNWITVEEKLTVLLVQN